MFNLLQLCILTLFILTANADVNLIKKENHDSNTTLLVIGGIHGNEPGGYFAASILATHYAISSKNLWIIPNLNKKSIIANKRGIHGDMNRKFSHINSNDKDINIVKEVKKIILSKNVSLVLNLHDGHGFYRKENQGSIFNPNAWGQTCVIDQCQLKQKQLFSNLNNIAETVKNNINKKLLKKHHSFNVKNTNTKYEDEAMQLSLTYFSVTNNKPAFAIETSKNLSTLSEKVFYQLLAIEEYMKIMDIKFHRDFSLTQINIDHIIKDYGTLVINHNFLLNLNNIKKPLSFIPLESKSNDFNFSNPLGEVKKFKGKYLIYVGNRLITTLKPQYFKLSQNCQEKHIFVIDGKRALVAKASEIFITDDFKIIESKNCRVNVIGYHQKGLSNESKIDISLNKLDKRYSIDKNAKEYRVEFYKNDEFCSMVLVHFK